MKIAATIILFVATLFVVDGVYSRVSIGETVKPDFLNLDAPAGEVKPAVEAADEEVIDGFIDTIRRRRTQRQSRFC